MTAAAGARPSHSGTNRRSFRNGAIIISCLCITDTPAVKKRDNYYAKLDAEKYGADAVPTNILQEAASA